MRGSSEALALDGGSKRRVRRAHAGDISQDRLDEFFAALAETCNVALSARIAEDRLDINRETFRAGEAPSVPLVEVRE